MVCGRKRAQKIDMIRVGSDLTWFLKVTDSFFPHFEYRESHHAKLFTASADNNLPLLRFPLHTHSTTFHSLAHWDINLVVDQVSL